MSRTGASPVIALTSMSTRTSAMTEVRRSPGAALRVRRDPPHGPPPPTLRLQQHCCDGRCPQRRLVRRRLQHVRMLVDVAGVALARATIRLAQHALVESDARFDADDAQLCQRPLHAGDRGRAIIAMHAQLAEQWVTEQ